MTLEFPAPLQQRVINALRADPKTVDLRAQAAHFFALGSKIMELFDDPDVLDTLVNVCNVYAPPDVNGRGTLAVSDFKDMRGLFSFAD